MVVFTVLTIVCFCISKKPVANLYCIFFLKKFGVLREREREREREALRVGCMGEHDERGSGLLPNGLVPNEAGSVMRVVGDGDSDRWLKAEKRTAQLIACIQPNSPSEDRRNAVAHYVQRLIRKCFPCEVLLTSPNAYFCVN